MSISKNKHRLMVVLAALICSVPFTTYAEEEKATTEIGTAVLSQYIWRGQELSRDSLVVEPYITVGYAGFSANIWGNIDTNTKLTDETKWTETDITLSYSKEIGMTTLTGGYIYYGLDSIDDSQELFASASLNVPLKPTLTIYREMAHYPSWYITAKLSHTVEFGNDITLDLSGTAAYLLSDDSEGYPKIKHGAPTGDEFKNLHDGLVSAVLNIPAAKNLKVMPQIAWSFPLSGDASNEMKWRSLDGSRNNFVYGGLAVSFNY
jgi:hypothetical protein